MALKKASSTKTARDTNWQSRLQYFKAKQPEMVATIREFVEIESPSDNKAATDRIGLFLAEKFKLLGGIPRLHQGEHFGDNLQIDFPGPNSARPVLLLGHFDTV
jgi:glutamate carboxypeptidase